MTEIALELKHISKSFDKESEVLKDISLTIRKGEFITLLGASGCGKTTTLRIIAGLEQPDAGSVFLEGKDVTALEPNQRDVNTVFQNYALFPHMTVADNVGYGLRLKKVPRAQIRKRVEEMLELVQLPGYGKRRPSELSGGQRQRVAIARALIGGPKVLLLDEPLGALDLQLRRAMQAELKNLQKKLGITFVYITHDQEEAVNMSDRIAVMHEGRLEQIGTAQEIYRNPATEYVASFIRNANTQNTLLKDNCPEETYVEDTNLKDTYLKDTYLKEAFVEEAVVQEVIQEDGMYRMVLLLPDDSRVTLKKRGNNLDVKPGQKILYGMHTECADYEEKETPIQELPRPHKQTAEGFRSSLQEDHA